MGTGALTNRSLGQTILASFYNDIHGVLEGDFVGHDPNTGNPLSGQNLGNQAYPWGACYINSLILAGQAFDPTILESSPYKIVSGAVRATSNQPQFITPAGSSLNYTIQTSPNLILQIAGVSATWSSNKTSAGTAAPSSSNTATVNDATASNQAATRTWGEYGSQNPFYPITITGAGTNITARVGSYQAFKIGTEYFIAFVESTTSLSRCFRGYFFDSSGLPIKRTTFSNSATITLMNLGYVFLDSDGATVDTIFTGTGVNNAPTYAFTAPTSPANGDYWYDQTNTVWKKYNGSSWAIVNRILAGLVVCDSSNCVAARSGDFFGLVRADNSIELAFSSSTVVKAQGIGQRVNVNGKRVYFYTNRPSWDTAANLAGTSDRYNAAVSASSTEYFYVTDQGDTKISDIEPYWRADLLGWYHPYNPWRWVGQDTPDGSANFQSSTLQNAYSSFITQGSVDRKKLGPAGQQASSSCGSYTTNSASYSDVTNLSITITTSGRGPIVLALIGDGTTNSANLQPATTANIVFQLVRGGSTVVNQYLISDSSGGSYLPPGLLQVDNQPAGTYTYKIQAKTSNGGVTVNMNNLVLVAWEQ